MPANYLQLPSCDDLGQLYGEVLGAFEEVALLATVESTDINDVLRLVGRRLCELLNVSRCSVYLLREDGRFQGQVGYCVGRRSIDAGVSRLVSGVNDDLFTAEIVRTSAPVLIQNATKDHRTIQRTMRQWGVRDMLGVPLVVDGEVIGIIYVDNVGEPHDYTEREVSLAQAFASLAALAVRQGWLYRRLGERTRVIDEQRRILGESDAVHNRVTRAVLDGADITEILHLIVELLDKPTVLYGPEFDVVAWAAPGALDLKRSPAITSAQASLPRIKRALSQLNDGRSTVMLRADPELRCRRLLVRMVVDGHCVGYLELLELGRSFTAVDSKALEQAAMAVSSKLLSVQRNTDIHHREREEYFADMLCGRRDTGLLTSRAETFGVDVDRDHVVLRLQYDQTPDGDGASGNQRRSNVMTMVSDALGAEAYCVACTGVPGADVLLLELRPREQVTELLMAELERLFPKLALVFGVRFAITSDVCRRLADLPRQSDKVREAAEILRETRASPRVVSSRDLELIRLITRRDGVQGVIRRSEEVLNPLVEHDAATGGALVETLRAFVSSQAQIRATATELAVHENTVRYRLNRIREVAAIEPERLDVLLSVSMAMQLQSLCAPALPSARGSDLPAQTPTHC